MSIRILFVAVFILFKSIAVSSQSSLPEKGQFSDFEVSLKECAFEKDAEAVILLDEAFSYHDDAYQLITKRRIRIKILNEKGLEWATVTIPFYSKDKFEFITDIEAKTYNFKEDGRTFTSNSVGKKDIYSDKKNERYSLMKFALPAVKPGSIIEYSYTSIMKHYGGLSDWEFQSEIPTLKSVFLLTILPNTEFSYVITKKPEYKMIILPKPATGQIYYEMNDIPGLKYEAYMNAPKDYLQKVEFQLSSYKDASGNKTKVTDTWAMMARELNESKELGSAIKKDLPGTDPLRILVQGKTSNTEKLAIIYRYIQENFTWNGLDSKFTESLKKTIEKRNGSSGDLNLLLVNLLQIFDIEAYPIVVAERNYGRIDPAFPFIDRFNKTAVFAVADEKTYVLDATEKYCPPGLTPYSLLNTYALVIDKKTKDLVKINSGDYVFSSQIEAKSKLDKDGMLSGNAVINNNQYALQFYGLRLKEGEQSFVTNYIEKDNQGIDVNNFTNAFSGSNSDTLTLKFDFKKDFDDNSGFILLNYNLFTGHNKNPFTKNERFTDINFGYPYAITVEHEIELAPGVTVEDIPKNNSLVSTGKEISISRTIEKSGNKLIIKLNFAQTKSLYAVADYLVIKKFYTEMIGMLNEPIAIKK